MKRLNFSLRTKLILLFVAFGLTPMLISNGISFLDANEQINAVTTARTVRLTKSKVGELKSYFSSMERTLIDVANTHQSIDALNELSKPFENAKVETSSDVYKKTYSELRAFYTGAFSEKYKADNSVEIDMTDALSRLDPVSVMAQNDFIVQNEFPLGKKDQLFQTSRTTPYSERHSAHHAYFRAIMTNHGFYDVFLVNASGRVVYTVFKELDFATSLKTGPWADTGLARAFEATSKMKKGATYFEDYSSYLPSYGAAAGFMSTPLFEGDTYLGAVIFQVPIEKVTALFEDRSSIGKFGDYYVIAKDGTLRTPLRRIDFDGGVAVKKFTVGSATKVESEVIKATLENESGQMEGRSYDGLDIIGAYQEVSLGQAKWKVVTELGKEEVFAGLTSLRNSLLIMLLVSAILVAVGSYVFGTRLSGSLMHISEMLTSSSKQVSNSSSQSASSSTELSEAATEQAASLQETMASIEEISAMVNQNAESASRAKVAVDANQTSSEDGARSVDEMMRSISEIKTTNDDILAQMESSNKEFGEIVKIISDIGEKTTVINDIVFQTKLLSFNASVEAARAGEHGKGFAVVAEEVGNLAQMSGNAAREISEMLAQSIKRVNGIVEQTRDRVDQLVEVGKDKITMGQSTAQKCRDSLSKITENAKSMSSMISEITHASKEQAQGIQEINKAISQLDQVTQQNSAVAQQSSSQAEELNSQAADLQAAVVSLVELINGNGDQPTATAEKSEPAASSNILKLKLTGGASKPKPQAGNSKKAASVAHKKASGSDVVPSPNDPGFEEF